MKSTSKISNVNGRKKPANKKPVIHSFPIVAIGASAGGLEAVSLLLQNLTADTGMAFIYVQHLNRDHKSMLTTLLARATKMKVQKIENMELIKPNNVYVIPHNKGIKVTDGHIQLIPRPEKISTNHSIDILFSSLAETHKENVIGVILSGNASDGTKGLKAIKKAGGLTFAQDKTAKYASMPESAINEGAADFVLSPKEIAKKLIALSKKESLKFEPTQELKEGAGYDNNPDLSTIFGILYKSNGIDFSHYKLSTIKRRIQRRVLKNNSKSIKDYAKFLSVDKKEAETLYADLLINVTSFFRDTETFRYLKSTLIPKLLKDKRKNETLRIWVPACSTGQEVYTIAILISEVQEKQKDKIPVQIFATDLSEKAIQIARLGEYSKAELKSVSQVRFDKFFTKTKNKFRIASDLREMCVFGTSHNILRDPPFSKMDFISCRNLLIYFDSPAQKKVLTTLHFSLNEKGYLMLGKSETIGSASTHFAQVNSKFKIYSRKKNAGIRKVTELTPRYPKSIIPGRTLKPFPSKNMDTEAVKLDNLINSVLLTNYMPACAIVNKDMEILQFRGSTSLFLVHPSGRASLNILKMTRPEFAFELRNAILQAIKTKQTVIKSGIEVKINSLYQIMTLEVSPIKFDWDEPLLLIVFTLQEQIEKHTGSDKHGLNSSFQKDQRIKRLTDELNHARTEIHSVIETQETAYEELQTANEEVVSSNEEFQTLNEELESTKEEIEAANEELIATNRELKKHNDLLEESYNYSQTIIATIHEPMIVLDSDLHVKSANKSFYKKFNVNKEDTERKNLFELGNKQWDIPKLHELLESILSKNSNFENFEVTHTFPGVGEKVMLLNASRIIQKTHREKLILLAIKDITERALRQRTADGKKEIDIRGHKQDKLDLEKEVKGRTKELELKNIELETANKDLVSFNYISSHDLQEPLRKIQTFATCLLDGEKNLTDKGKEYLKRMTQTANRMRYLIEDLLSYSRTKSDDRVFESADINLLLAEVKKEFEDIMEEKHSVIEAANLCKVNVIPFQFRQLFHNLISNSLKFSKPDIPVHIVIKSNIGLGSFFTDKRLIADEKYCHLTFMDNGIGFDSQYRERIFEVFQRLHSVLEFPGTGIGLAICKRIVENHNGFITASSKLNEGAQFDIYIYQC